MRGTTLPAGWLGSQEELTGRSVPVTCRQMRDLPDFLDLETALLHLKTEAQRLVAELAQIGPAETPRRKALEGELERVTAEVAAATLDLDRRNEGSPFDRDRARD